METEQNTSNTLLLSPPLAKAAAGFAPGGGIFDLISILGSTVFNRKSTAN